MSRIAIALAILALSVGCTAATTTGSHAATDGRLVDDAQLYSAAYESAVDALEATPSEGFDAHLARALGAIGLTPRGFRVTTAHHPELAARLDAAFADRIAAAELRARVEIAATLAPAGEHLAFALARP